MARYRTCDESSLKLLELLQNDLKSLSIETRKKYPHIKEACEESIVKLRNAILNPQTPIYHVTNQILYPIVQGCETKDSRIVKLCLGMIQKLITHQTVDHKGARFISDTLWMLMENGVEQVKILQSVTLLLTTNCIVHGDTLAKNLVLCFRLHFSKDSTTANTAGATVRQLVSLVFERVTTEDLHFQSGDVKDSSELVEELKIPSGVPPKTLRACAADAYLMFQDLVQLVNADQPFWLNGLTEMTRTFGLELLELVLVKFAPMFFKHPEFSFLLKERVCPLVIKLFSPNIKFRASTPGHHCAVIDKPYFPISIRLLRVVSTLVHKFHSILVTECEIFLSLIVKFVDPEKPGWQRAVALEVVHKMSVEPELLMSFCDFYDLNSHSANIFQDIVNCLGGYVQCTFNNPQVGSNSAGTISPAGPPSLLGGILTGPGLTTQPAFYSKGQWLPVVTTYSPGQVKTTFLDMMDRVEPPHIPDGYGISLAYSCFLEIVRSLGSIVQQRIQSRSSPTRNISPKSNRESGTAPSNQENTYSTSTSTSTSTFTERDVELYSQLINSSWCGILSALIQFIDRSTDETITENVLKAMITFTSIAGSLEMHVPRDSFITAMCKAALPPNYSIPIPASVGGMQMFTQAQEGHPNQLSSSACGSPRDTDYKQQVVAVGTPLPTSSTAASPHQGPVMLTSKNLQCMRELLTLANDYGCILGSSWQLVLTTVQHLVWILGLKPSTGGCLKAGRSTADTNAVITTAMMADLPVLSSMLSSLFESSQYLDDVALHHLIDALCKLSHEAMELAYCNREPSLFAVAKLLETGMVNLSRIGVLWKPVTNHLLEVCQHPHIRMREWGVEAITYLVKSSLHYKYTPNLRENPKLQILLLSPLVELSTIPHCDVRHRQLDCVLHILHNSGELLTQGWPLVLNMVGAISEKHGEHLIRSAFQCLQLIVTDFLPLMPLRCLPLCLETTAKFGSQSQELNISLTAIGLMWNIADYLFHNREKLCQSLLSETALFLECFGNADMPSFDKLWMCLYTRLSNLCVDCRPAVRKSAGQTLFSTLSAHGSLLCASTWQAVFWQILFPLLEKVKQTSSHASDEKVDTGSSILIHHTRNTAQKQWAETQVLTLSGVSRVFNAKRELLQTLGNFLKAWTLLLEFIQDSALSYNNEVCLAALRSFQEILYANGINISDEAKLEIKRDVPPLPLLSVENETQMWNVAWNVWSNIAVETLERPNRDLSIGFPSQSFLAALIRIFPAVFRHYHSRLTGENLNELCRVLEWAVAVPVNGDTTASYLPSSDSSITQLQEGVVNCFYLLQNHAHSSPENMELTICPVFAQLLSLTKYAYQAPSHYQKRIDQKETVAVNYVPFGERMFTMIVNLYQDTAEEPAVTNGNILKEIIRVFHFPLSKRYDKEFFGTWKLVVASFMNVLSYGIPLARKHPDKFRDMWPQLAFTLDSTLFPNTCELVNGDGCIDQNAEDEVIDCQIIAFLKEEVMSHSSTIPKEFILQVVVLLNKGSVLSTARDSLIQTGKELSLREDFANVCFENLLQFSLLDGAETADESWNGCENESELSGRLAVTALIFRFQEVLQKYIADKSRAGKCPLPRHRLAEISFVLKSISTLIRSLKRTPNKATSLVWNQLINLYPHLVVCAVTPSDHITASLRSALQEYYDLLTPPSSQMSTMAISE